MATKTSRLDLRLTEEQHQIIETAASLAGSTLSGWSVSTLTNEAARQINDHQLTMLAPAAWDEFLTMLESPEDPRTTDLLNRKPVWEQ
jgi:uncharacterized protein (DUF1778 family)